MSVGTLCVGKERCEVKDHEEYSSQSGVKASHSGHLALALELACAKV